MGALYYLVGLPGSGKTTYAKELECNIGAIRLSSDELRKELFGDIDCQDKNTELFEEMNKRAKLALKSGRDVVYDATNINSKKRKGFLKQLPKDVNKICIYFAEPIISCIKKDSDRDRRVGYSVISRMHNHMQIPMYHEGFDDIRIHYTERVDDGNDIFDFIEDYTDYEFLLENNLKLCSVIDFPQDTPYHTLSVSRHMYYAYDYIKQFNNKYLNIAALLHDIGKPKCKVYKGKYASYYGHENLSSQIATIILKSLGFEDKDIIHIVTLIQLHMRLHNKELGSKSKERFKDEIGSELFEELVLLNNADSQAK